MEPKIDLREYNYCFPPELIAKYPLERREDSRLMVLKRKSREIIHTHFYKIENFLQEGDLLVRNASRVIPARIFGRKKSRGGKVEILVLDFNPAAEITPALIASRSRLNEKEVILLPEEKEALYLGKKEGIHYLRFNFDNLLEYFFRNGEVPLPPYLKRKPEPIDSSRYQTIYAKSPGSVAAPTAGLHFAPQLIRELEEKGVRFVDLYLHVSYATFRPLSQKELSSGRLHREYFEIPPETASEINQARAQGRRVIAVGTTTVRALESQADKGSQGNYEVRGGRGQTDLFIYPPYQFKVLDALITNFHFPKSSLILLVSAFAGKEFILKAYEEAVRNRYRFFSYGDCMLIL